MLCVWEIQKEHGTITESNKISKDRAATLHTEIHFLHHDQFTYLPFSSDLSESTGIASCSQQIQQATLCGPYSVSVPIPRSGRLALPMSTPPRETHTPFHLPRTLLPLHPQWLLAPTGSISDLSRSELPTYRPSLKEKPSVGPTVPIAITSVVCTSPQTETAFLSHPNLQLNKVPGLSGSWGQLIALRPCRHGWWLPPHWTVSSPTSRTSFSLFSSKLMAAPSPSPLLGICFLGSHRERKGDFLSWWLLQTHALKSRRGEDWDEASEFALQASSLNERVSKNSSLEYHILMENL